MNNYLEIFRCITDDLVVVHGGCWDTIMWDFVHCYQCETTKCGSNKKDYIRQWYRSNLQSGRAICKITKC
jgi:hypothetical protein